MKTMLTAVCFALSLCAPTGSAAAPCPGAAAWCDGFADGAARWQVDAGAAAPAMEMPGSNTLLLQPGSLLASRDTPTANLARYHVEARMRTRGGAGQAQVLLEYVDARNWLGAGIDVKPGSPKINLVVVRMQDGRLTRLKEWGKESLPDAAFYTVRLARDGAMLTLYLNGERLTELAQPPIAGGRIGLASQGAAFEFADVRVGAAALAPARLGLARVGNRIAAQAGDAPQRFYVQAAAGTLLQARSSDPTVASARIDGRALVVSAHRPGHATVGVVDAGDASVAAWLGVQVAPRFAPDAPAYAAPGRLVPAAGSAAVPVDSVLRIRFDRPPLLGEHGSVRIFRAADGALVDTIHVGAERDLLGAPRQALKRVVRRKLIALDGASAVIRPHSAALAHDTDYLVQVDPGVFRETALGGRPFAGIGPRQRWRFSTAPAPRPDQATLVVDDDGAADFRTVQGALNHAMGRLARAAPVTIAVANGRYDELLYLQGKDNVTVRGESRDGVVIGAFNDDGTNPGSGAGQSPVAAGANGGRAVFLVEDADLLVLDRLTLVNTARRAGSLGAQAEALNFNSHGRLVATDASFFSEQDTLQLKGYAWFYRTLVAGNVDFIWGGNRAALFEDSEIRTLGDSANPASGGYVVQARTLGAADPGFVFLDSRLTHGPGPGGNDAPPGATFLARPGTANSHDKVTYIRCRMDRHVAAAGWALPRGAHAGAGAGWGESGSMDMAGAPLDLGARNGARQLSAAQAAALGDRIQVFAGFNNGQGWNPALPSTQRQP